MQNINGESTMVMSDDNAVGLAYVENDQVMFAVKDPATGLKSFATMPYTEFISMANVMIKGHVNATETQENETLHRGYDFGIRG